MAKSRQQLWQEKQVAEGNCRICGEPRNLGKQLCDVHLLAVRKHLRVKLGLHAWRKGHRGRPPLT